MYQVFKGQNKKKLKKVKPILFKKDWKGWSKVNTHWTTEESNTKYTFSETSRMKIFSILYFFTFLSALISSITSPDSRTLNRLRLLNTVNKRSRSKTEHLVDVFFSPRLQSWYCWALCGLYSLIISLSLLLTLTNVVTHFNLISLKLYLTVITKIIHPA